MNLMGENLKNKIQSIFLHPVAHSLKFSGRWFGVFFLIFLGLVLPLQSANAIAFLAPLIAFAIINVALQLILLISNLILGLAGVILNWVLSPYFMSLPYTYGGIVDIGWPIVRDFVNMFFIIALVIIGLSTALRIKEYQAQKALPLLIIIAILINFTPVICGAIIDATNIVMNFFLEEIAGFKDMLKRFGAQGTMIKGAFTGILNPLELPSLMGKAIIMIIFNLVAAFIFLMYALLFIMRYVMIWVLVIVSPLAFFSRVFPGAQKYFFKSILGWDEWWKQFIEWSMIGVIGAFFLYLGEQIMTLAPGWIPGIPPGGAWGIITTPLVDFINQLLPWGVALAFLIIGFIQATTTSAMGATAITKLAKKSMTGMRKVAAGMAWEGIKKARQTGKQWGGGLAGGIEKFAAKYPKIAAPITAPTKLAKWAGRGVARIIPERVKTGAGYADRGLRKAWKEVGKPIFNAGWEPFRKEIFGKKPVKKKTRKDLEDETRDLQEELSKAETPEERESILDSIRDLQKERDEMEEKEKKSKAGVPIKPAPTPPEAPPPKKEGYTGGIGPIG